MKAMTPEELVQEGIFEQLEDYEVKNDSGIITEKWKVYKKKSSGGIIKEKYWDKAREEKKLREQEEQATKKEAHKQKKIQEKALLKTMTDSEKLDWLIKKSGYDLTG